MKAYIYALIKKNIGTQFGRNVLILLIGSGISQVIAILKLPVLSRIFTPADFGNLAVVMTISNIGGTILALRYEMAIMLPKLDKVAFQVLQQALLITLFMVLFESIVLSIILKLFFVNYYQFILPIVVISLSKILLQAFSLWFNRRNKFYLTSAFAVTRVLLIFVLQYFFRNRYGGLIYGLVWGEAIISILLVGLFIKNSIFDYAMLSKRKFFFILKRFKKFPVYSLPASFMNSGANNIQFLVVEHIFGPAYAGVFSMAFKLVFAPVNFIAGSLNKVVYQKFSKNVVYKQPVFKNMKKLALAMFGMGIVIAFVAFIAGKVNFITWILGENWQKTNDLILYLFPVILTATVSKSIARFSIFEKQEVGLYFQTLMLFTVFFSLVLGAAITGNFKNTVIVYSVALSCIFLVQLNVSLFLAKRHDKSIEVERND